MTRTNEHGQPIGDAVDWTPPPFPPPRELTGTSVRVVPTDAAAHADELFASFTDPRVWTYMQGGPFDDAGTFGDWLAGAAAGDDPMFHTLFVDGRPVGLAAYLRIAPAAGSIEVGSIHFSPALQRTRAATEAMFLMMRNAFDLGYRRYEWKCDDLNAASRAAALRLGFRYEGTFRKALVYKGRNRDTAWFAITDDEWPAIRAGFEDWLDPSNFDDDGVQRRPLDVRA